MPQDLLPDHKPEKSYQPAKWTQRHRMVVSLHISGYSNNEIAEALDYTPVRVSIILNDPRAKHDIENALADQVDKVLDVAARFEDLSNKAVDTMEEIMDEAIKDEVRLKAATGILDRAGYTPIRREVQVSAEVPADPELVARIAETLKESRSSKIIYDISPSRPSGGQDTTLLPPGNVVEGDFEVEVTGTDG